MHAMNALANDGVTCTVCHRVAPEGLGEAASFTAGFAITKRDAIFGPHADPFEMPMLHHTGFRPAESRHVLSSALCGSCHTLVIEHEGKQFAEQAPFLEWRASAYAREGKACISCHMPALAQPQYVAHRPPGGPFPPTRPRTPFRKHLFLGANTPLTGSKGLLRTAASLEARGARTPDGVAIDVTVTNLAGHKLPTGYPGRRMWLHVRVWDKAGALVWESGDESSVDSQPHRAVVASPREAVVYEAVLADARGARTDSLVDARTYDKDNRLLPRGYVAGERAIEPVGIGVDKGFRPAGHSSRFLVRTSRDGAPYRAAVELLFQSVPPRDLDRLLPVADNAEELREFRARAAPVTMAKQEITLE